MEDSGMQMRILAILMLLIHTLCFENDLFAMTNTNSPIEKTKIVLNELMPINEPIRLKNAISLYDIFLPIANRLDIKSIKFHLELQNSISLLKDRSSLSVLVNDKVIAQLPLNPNLPEISTDILIPTYLLKVGYNRLTFRAQQHYTLKCEDPAAPELWTEIDTIRSYFIIESLPKTLPPKLSMLKEIFDPKIFVKKPIQIMIPENNIIYNRFALLAAQGIGLRMEYMQPLFDIIMPQPAINFKAKDWNFPGLNQEFLRGNDVIYIAEKDKLSEFLNQNILNNITGPFIGIYSLDIEPMKYIILISGRNDEDIEKAIKAFCFMNFPFPDTQYMIIQEQDIPSISNITIKNVLHPNGMYLFSDLGFRTKTIRGSNPETINIDVYIPPYLYALERDVVKFDLHLAYAAGMRKDSTLNILINNHFERAIWLNDDAGGLYTHYIVTIPLRSFKPGPNRISFASNLIPMVTGECQLINSDGLIVNLFDDSFIVMPNVPTFVELPDLKLFATCAFPYNFKADGSEVAVLIPQEDNKSLASAATILAKIAQLTGNTLYKISVVFDVNDAKNKDILVVSSINQTILDLAKHAPIAFLSNNITKTPYPIARNVDSSREIYRGLLNQFWFLLKDIFIPYEFVNSQLLTFITQKSGLGDTLLIMQYESYLAHNRTITMFLAENSNILHNNIIQLVLPSVWNNLQLASCIFNPTIQNDQNSLACQTINSRYNIGQKTYTLSFYFSRHPWFWITVVIITISVLAFIIHRLLKLYKRKKHANLQEDL
jgi:hypothetical protein